MTKQGHTAAIGVLACVVGVGLGACQQAPNRAGVRYQARLSDAKRLLAEGKYPAAADQLKLMLQSNPRRAEAHFYLAVCYHEMGRSKLAIEGFRTAIRLDRQLTAAYHNLGSLYLMRGQYEAARYWLEEGLKWQPDHVASYVNLAKVYFRLGRAELAGAAYEEALARDPRCEAALEGMAQLCAAAGEKQLARSYYERFAKTCTDQRRRAELKEKLRL